MKFMDIKINNSKKAAIHISKTRRLSDQWKDPGAKLYTQLLNANHIEGNRVPDGSEEFEKLIKDGKYTTWQDYLREAYMVAPVKDIHNSPHGVTPFSRSGCKYPHHVIKNGELVVSIPGLRAAYICARNNGVLVNHTPENKAIVAHFNRHFKELGLKPEWHHGEFCLFEESELMIERNFHDMYSFIMEKTGINLFDDAVCIDEISRGRVLRINEGPDTCIPLDFNSSLFAIETMESAMSNESIIFSSKLNKEIGTTPEEIYEWMHTNIKYDDDFNPSSWKLRTPSEVFTDRRGICHDLSLFEAFYFHSLNIVNGQLFFTEVDDNGHFGNSHTLTWFRKGGNGYSDFKEPYDEASKYNGKYEYFWFEVAWESQAGIHGPYDTIDGIKDAVIEAYKNDDDINSHTFSNIAFSEFSNYRCGMSIGEYVESWRFNKDPITINESTHVEYMDEKSHGSLKYCYRVGFDVNSGKEVAIEFILEPDAITSVGDMINIKHTSMKSGTKVNVLDIADKALTTTKENIRKYGHIDFTTDNLKVHKIFFRNGESVESIDFIPMFSKEVTTSMNKVARLHNLPRGTSSIAVFNHNQFPSILQQEIRSNNSPIEHYQVGEMSGKDKYKTTKLMWDHDLFLSYKYTPVFRGVNGKGRYIYNKPEDINDMRNYLKKYLNNKYSESYIDDINIVNSIFSESIFHGHTRIGVNIPYNIGYGYSGDMSIEDIYTEAIIFDTDSMNDNTSVVECVNEYMNWIYQFVHDDEFRESVFNESYTLQTLPDKLYFGTPNKISGNTISAKSPRGLFLTPYPGIASIFIIDRPKELGIYLDDILKANGRGLVSNNCNLDIAEWYKPDNMLKKVLTDVHLYHNIPEFTEIKNGSSEGYIYQIDVSEVKQELQTFVTNDPNREVVYKGSARLPITGVIHHTVNWSLTYKDNGQRGTFESRVINESSIGTPNQIGRYIKEDGSIEEPPSLKEDEAAQEQELKKESMPKQTDAAESNKNGIRRKKLYIAFIEWCKAYNNKNVFGSIFDKDAFKVTYPFVPDEMRYFYRLANPILCVLGGELTFFQASELRKLNSGNSRMNEMLIFAATPTDMRVFNTKDKKVYRGTDENGQVKLNEVLGETFDLYIQKMINQGDILNGPIEESVEEYEIL